MSKLLIITGGSKGIGLKTIVRFQQAGYDIINISRTTCQQKKVNQITCDLSQAGWEATFSPQLTSQLSNNLDKVDDIVLVHNAATYLSDQVQTLTAEKLRYVLECNVIAPTVLNQLILPHMNAGAIIYVGSTLSEIAVPHYASYITSKHAIAGLMKATCQDLAGTNITTTCVCPGITETDMIKERINNDHSLRKKLESVQTANRLIQPEEIADLIYFCATHPVMNGAVVHGNLGQRA